MNRTQDLPRCERKPWNGWFRRAILASNRTTDLDAIDHRKAVDTLRSATIQEQVLTVLKTNTKEVKPKLDKAIKQRIQQTAEAGLNQTQGNLPAAFRFLNADSPKRLRSNSSPC